MNVDYLSVQGLQKEKLYTNLDNFYTSSENERDLYNLYNTFDSLRPRDGDDLFSPITNSSPPHVTTHSRCNRI